MFGLWGNEEKRRIREVESRLKASGLVDAVARYRSLAQMQSCAEADEAQLSAALTMGEGWEPIECPHCGITPAIEELARNRPPCQEIGHPEQMQGRHFAGMYPIECPLCGETPDFGPPMGRRAHFWLPL